jgi:hypothetical protein
MGKTFKRNIPQAYDDDKFEKHSKGRHLKHSQHISNHSEEFLDPEEDFEYREEVEHFIHKWK